MLLWVNSLVAITLYKSRGSEACRLFVVELSLGACPVQTTRTHLRESWIAERQNNNNNKARRERKKLTSQQQGEHTVSMMMICVTSLFVVCNCLNPVLNIIEMIEPDWMLSNNALYVLYYVLADISNLLIVLYSSSSWWIYYKFSKRFRILFLNSLCCNESIRRRLLTGKDMESLAGPQLTLANINGQQITHSHLPTAQSKRTPISSCGNTTKTIPLAHANEMISQLHPITHNASLRIPDHKQRPVSHRCGSMKVNPNQTPV